MKIKEYLRWKGIDHEPASRSYRPHLERLKEIVGHIPKTTDDIVRYKAMCLERGLDPNTVMYALRAVKNYLFYLESIGVKALNPSLIRVQKPIIKPRDFAVKDEYEACLKVLNRYEFGDLTKRIFLHLLWAGLRISEIAALDVSNVDLNERCMKILTKKSRIPRFVAWGERAHDDFIRYLGVRICLNQRAPLLIALRGRGRLTTRSLQRWEHEICERAGIKDHSCHDWRHGKAHYIKYVLHGDLDDVKTCLGHSSVSSSERYLLHDAEESKRISQKFA